MVAGDREIVTDKVHDVDDRFALRQRADRAALAVVACVDEKDFVAFRLKGLLEVCNACIAPAVADAAVHVVREQNDRVARRLNDRRFRRFAGLRIEIHDIASRVIGIQTVAGEVVMVILQVLILVGVLCSIALDIKAAFGRFKPEECVCSIIVVAFYKLNMRSINVQILAFCGLERVGVVAFFVAHIQFGRFRVAAMILDFNGQNDCRFRNGQNAFGQRCRRRNELMLAVVVEVILGGHDNLAFRIEDDNLIAVQKLFNKLHRGGLGLGLRLGGGGGFGLGGGGGLNRTVCLKDLDLGNLCVVSTVDFQRVNGSRCLRGFCDCICVRVDATFCFGADRIVAHINIHQGVGRSFLSAGNNDFSNIEAKGREGQRGVLFTENQILVGFVKLVPVAAGSQSNLVAVGIGVASFSRGIFCRKAPIILRKVQSNLRAFFRNSRAELDCGEQDKHHQDCQDQRNGFSHVSFFPPY